MIQRNEASITVAGVTKKYGRFAALSGVSFDIGPGQIVALLGPNGAGKTTTFKCILGVTEFEGEIKVAGHSVKRSGKEARRSIGYVPQSPAFLGEDTCERALSFLADLRGVPRRRVGELLAKVHLERQQRTRADRLSGGMRQRLALAAALLSDPPVLLLDEPTANLDFESRGEFHDLLGQLRAEGKTIIVSTHFVEHIAVLADRVIVLHAGSLVLDRDAVELWGKTEKHFAVYLNGTEPGRFVAAMRELGIRPEASAPTGLALEAALARALAEGREGAQR
jgi:ABC-type multidrug transport system ATPase subunit